MSLTPETEQPLKSPEEPGVTSHPGTCSTCKHWATNMSGDDNHCSLMSNVDRGKAWVDIDMARLMTKPDFGCNQWEESEQSLKRKAEDAQRNHPYGSEEWLDALNEIKQCCIPDATVASMAEMAKLAGDAIDKVAQSKTQGKSGMQ